MYYIHTPDIHIYRERGRKEENICLCYYSKKMVKLNIHWTLKQSLFSITSVVVMRLDTFIDASLCNFKSLQNFDSWKQQNIYISLLQIPGNRSLAAAGDSLWLRAPHDCSPGSRTELQSSEATWSCFQAPSCGYYQEGASSSLLCNSAPGLFNNTGFSKVSDLRHSVTKAESCSIFIT